MFFPLFFVDSLWFLLLSAALLIALLAVSETDAGAFGFVWLGVWLVVSYVLVPDFHPIGWVVAHWLLTIVLVIGYVIAGVAYAYFRWLLMVRDPASYVGNSYNGYNTKVGDPLDPNYYKNRIIGWMLWWPVSLAWWLLRWPRKLFTALFNALYSSFKKIADNNAPPPPVVKQQEQSNGIPPRQG